MLFTVGHEFRYKEINNNKNIQENHIITITVCNLA